MTPDELRTAADDLDRLEELEPRPGRVGLADRLRRGAEWLSRVSRPVTCVDRLRADGWEDCDPRLEVHPEICECQGLGLVPPDWMVETAANAMEWFAPNVPHRWFAMARAALVAAARAVKEKEWSEVVNIRWVTDGTDIYPPIYVELTLADGSLIRYLPEVRR